MKKDTRIVMLSVSLLTLVSSSYLAARQNQKMANTDSEVLDFEELKYPALARMARIAGAVVIRVKLDDQGKVVGSETVSGAEPLAGESLTNVKKWRFQPNPHKSAVVVYNFRIPGGVCKSASSLFMLQGPFKLQGPNLATILGCGVPIETSKVSEPSLGYVGARQREATADTDSYALEFEDVKYPANARAARLEGVVVIRVKLDNEGKVVGAERISGPDILARDCISSVKKWRFRPVPQKSAVVVYNFTMPGGLCKSATSLMFLGPNLATIIGCDVPGEAAK